MKVLFISNYRDGTGYSSAALSYIEAMDSVGIDLVIRPVRFNDASSKLPERILELEQRNSSDCDVVIQYTLPHFMQYHGGFKKNIAMFESETDSVHGPNWHTHLNLMDEIWATNSFQYQILTEKHHHNQQIHKPVYYVGHAIDTEKFQRSYNKLPIGADGMFMFYFVGEFNRRKNLGAIVKAFHSEFHPQERVGLLFKVNIPGVSVQETAKRCADYCNQVKDGLKLYQSAGGYHREYIVTDKLDDETLYSLYNACDCFVNASRGEGWCIPCAESAAMGKAIIASKCGGMMDYLNDDTAWLVAGSSEPCFGAINVELPDMYRADENWYEVSVGALRRAMREAFENKKLREQKTERCVKNIFEKFNKKVVGERIKNLLLEDATNAN
jgi:glycosyltransferase involved in cell wall biosynthesis